MDNKIYPEHLSTSEFSAGSARLPAPPARWRAGVGQGSALGGQKGNSDSPLLSEESKRVGQDRPAYLVVSETESFPHVIKYACLACSARRARSAYFSRREFFKTFPMQLMKSIGFCLTGNLEEGERAGPGKRIRLDIERCLAWGGADCQLCYLACPLREQAIIMEDQKPVLRASACDGCGQCVRACETVNNHPALKIV